MDDRSELWRALLSLNREITEIHRHVLQLTAVLEGLTGFTLIERHEAEPKARLRLVVSNGRPVG